MSVTGFFVVFAVVAALLVLSAIRTARGRRERMDGLAAYAAKREWAYTPDGTGLEQRFTGEPFGRGRSRRTTNVVEGWYEGWAFVAFDYRYTTSSGDDSTVHRTSVVSVHLGDLAQPVPMLQVEPQGVVGRFFSALLGNDLTLGDPPFDDAFQVRTDSPELAHDVLHPDLRVLVSTWRDRAWRLQGDSLLVFRRGEHDPAEIDATLAAMKTLLDLVPPPVWGRLRGGEQPR